MLKRITYDLLDDLEDHQTEIEESKDPEGAVMVLLPVFFYSHIMLIRFHRIYQLALFRHFIRGHTIIISGISFPSTIIIFSLEITVPLTVAILLRDWSCFAFV